jgi:hypothetical protein
MLLIAVDVTVRMKKNPRSIFQVDMLEFTPRFRKA